MTDPASAPAAAFAAVESFVRRRTGLVFGAARRPSFEAALSAIMRRAGVRAPDAYLTRLEADPALLDDFVAGITVGETYFYRDQAQWSVIRDSVLPSLSARQGRGAGLRAWSAGCAAGAEPYTAAIVLREQGLAAGAHIIGSDISRAALAQARHAQFGRWALRGVPDATVQTYFQASGDRFTLASPIREAVDFRYLNLAEDVYPSLTTGIWGMDLILCRNVLIYFDAETIARVARRLVASLSDEGWLLLGASDPVISELVPCDVVMTGSGLAYRRRRTGHRPAPHVREVARVPAPSSDAARESVPERPRSQVAPAPEPTDELEAIARVRAFANRGELDAAGHACLAALERHRMSAELTYLHAVLLSEAGHHQAATVAARRALYLDRTLAVAHLALGGALARLGDQDGARRAFRNAERSLRAMAPDQPAPAADGEPAGRLAEMARVQQRLLGEVA